MSLQLRKECQTLLDGVGLENYHVDIDERTKKLQIVGECGQPFVSISGIRLSRMAPPSKEISLAVELFEAFLVKHTALFKEFTAAKKIADSCSVPLKIKAIKNSRIEKNKYNTYYELNFFMSEDDERLVNVNSKGAVIINKKDININDKPDDLKKVKASLTDKETNAIRSWVTACNLYNEAIEKRDKLKSKLSSCEI